MTTQPHALTSAEWEEIGAVDTIRQSWGLEEDESFADFAADNIYGMKFNFHSGSPGYIGDLYILQDDTFTGDPPFVLTRDRYGNLSCPIELQEIRR
jgi:hypothetical protein